MRYCKRCVNVDTRPDGAAFDDNGLCPVCHFAEESGRTPVDFNARRRELDEIVEWGKEHSRSSYDCIVTVSGGKDSMRQAFFARDELKLKSLLVSYVYPPEHQTDRGAYNLGNLINHGFDAITASLNPQVSKSLMRNVFFKYGNIFKATEMALYAVPIHVAIAYKIPLIFLGENPLYTIGQVEGDVSGGDASGMKYSNTLQGGLPDGFTDDDMSEQDTYFYRYPSNDDIDYAQLRMIYLGYYISDWSEINNGKFAMDRGLKVRENDPLKTGQIYPFRCLDEDFYAVNQMIKYVKFGFGAATDQVCCAISQGDMNRKEGLELVRKYDGKCDIGYIRKFCNYIGISMDEFWDVVERFRGHNVWKKGRGGNWELRCPLPEDDEDEQ